MCGRTPLEDGVKLQVDHKIPKEWGGTDDLENLQPLCEECNRGKKNLFGSYDVHADEIRAAITHESVHLRIGELLKAFYARGVRSDLVDLVAIRQAITRRTGKDGSANCACSGGTSRPDGKRTAGSGLLPAHAWSLGLGICSAEIRRRSASGSDSPRGREHRQDTRDAGRKILLDLEVPESNDSPPRLR